MNYKRNDGSIEENAVQNRFTAYLKVALEHNNSKYTAKLKERLFSEVEFLDNDDGSPYEEDTLFSGEIGDIRLQRAFSGLRELERIIMTKHVLQDRPLKVIAQEMNLPYPTVKSLYRRGVEKMRKELAKDEF